MNEFLDKPFAGWTKIHIGDVNTPSCSYLTDIPGDFINFFCNWFETGEATISLNYEEYGEGYIQISNCNMKIKTDKKYLTYRRTDCEEMTLFAERFTKDLADNLDLWIIWHLEQYDLQNEESLRLLTIEFLDKVNKLSQYLEMCGRNVIYCQSILSISKEVFENQFAILLKEL